MQFHIPKQTDAELLKALEAIRNDLADLRPLVIEVQTYEPGGPTVPLTGDGVESTESVKDIVALASQIMPILRLRDQPAGNRSALLVRRDTANITDFVKTPEVDDWPNQLPDKTRGAIIVRLIASARKHLRAPETEAALQGGQETAWSRYRDSQVEILNSLEQTQKTIATEYARNVVETQNEFERRYNDRASILAEETKQLQKTLTEQHDARLADLDQREQAIKARETSFNTKEARYVARQEQKNQITQVEKWLEGWSLTSGTRSKRWTTNVLYTAGIAVCLGVSVWLNYENYSIITSHSFQLQWWQWALLAVRSLGPFAAFLTFLIYFIRWSASWARQHSEEEFRNRARILDIGRTSWLLEAVRDAQDNKTELPPELLKELSRNLFVYNSPLEAGDIDPQSISDLILHGLSSLRVKTPDGTELEAKRGRIWPRGK